MGTDPGVTSKASKDAASCGGPAAQVGVEVTVR